MIIPKENLNPGRWYVGFLWKNNRQTAQMSLEWNGTAFQLGDFLASYRGFDEPHDGFEPIMSDLPPKPPEAQAQAA